MSTIIAGRYIRQDDAANAVARLVASGFARDDVTSFFVNPAGQHDRYSIGGDEDESPGTHEAGAGAAVGAAGGTGVGIAVGLATLPVLGPGAAAAGAAVGAYVGALMGALDNMKSTDGKAPEPAHVNGAHVSNGSDIVLEPRKSGMLVAVAVPDGRHEAIAADVLRTTGAADVERAEGTILGGEWADFDPLLPVTHFAS